MRNFLITALCCTASIFSTHAAHAYDMARYTPAFLDQILTQTPAVKNLTLTTPRKLRVQAYLAEYAKPCDTSVIKAAMTLQGAPRTVLESVAITQCIGITTDAGHSVRLYIQDQVAAHIPNEASIGARLTLYVDYLYQDESGPGMLVNEYDIQ